MQFSADQNPSRYDNQCALLDGPLGSAESVTYGINYRSPLNKIDGYHVANGQMPQDIKHDCTL